VIFSKTESPPTVHRVAGRDLESRWGWILRYPANFAIALILKLKNRSLRTAGGYAKHQREFFALTFRGDRSDKFWSVRTKIAHHALGEGALRALDVATGYGFQAVALKRAGFAQVVAIDLVPERIAHCRELFPDEGVDFEVMDCTRIAYPDKHFDSATVSAALHDMPNDVKRAAIAELARVTRHRIVVFEPRTFENRLAAFLYGSLGQLLDESLNFMDYVRDDLASILRASGLEIIEDENAFRGIMNIKVCRPREERLSLHEASPALAPTGASRRARGLRRPASRA
jgi:hypothetical protein